MFTGRMICIIYVKTIFKFVTKHIYNDNAIYNRKLNLYSGAFEPKFPLHVPHNLQD